MTEALKPCPFCGGEPFSFEDYGHSTAWEVGCSNSQCRVEPHVWEKTKDEAIASWNTRADLVDPAAIREAALREAADELYRWGDIYGDNAARSVLALIQVSASQNDKKEG